MLQIELLLIIMLTVVFFVFRREELRQQRSRLPMARVRYFWNGADRRDQERVNLVLKAHYQLARNHNKVPMESLSENISRGGLKLIAYERLKEGEEIELEIEIPPHEILQCKGKVIWVKELVSEEGETVSSVERNPEKEKRCFIIGLQFMELAPSVAERLDSFVNVESSAIQAPAA